MMGKTMKKIEKHEALKTMTWTLQKQQSNQLVTRRGILRTPHYHGHGRPSYSLQYPNWFRRNFQEACNNRSYVIKWFTFGCQVFLILSARCYWQLSQFLDIVREKTPNTPKNHVIWWQHLRNPSFPNISNILFVGPNNLLTKLFPQIFSSACCTLGVTCARPESLRSPLGCGHRFIEQLVQAMTATWLLLSSSPAMEEFNTPA